MLVDTGMTELHPALADLERQAASGILATADRVVPGHGEPFEAGRSS